MQNILHRGAKTTPKIRKETHDSTESLMVLAQRYNLNFKTILKWKHREDFSDKPSGAIKPKSVLSDQEQAVICEFRRITQLPLDDVFVELKDKIPPLTCSNLYRCLKRFGYQKLPKDSILKKERQSFKIYELGFIHLDIASLHTAEAKAQGDQSTLIECGYDYMGRRYTKKVTSNGTVSLHQRYIYRGYLQIACVDLSRSEHPALWYITWDPTEPVATRPLAIQKNATWYSYSHDLTKNVTELYQSDGLIATTYDYSPYGAVTAEGIDQPIQYSSEYHDAELALTYYNYRHYNPTDGRWINRDPLQEEGGFNLYGFVENSPLFSGDYLGLLSGQQQKKPQAPAPVPVVLPEFQLKNENEYTACEKTQVEKCKKFLEKLKQENFFTNFLKNTPCKVEVQCVLLKNLGVNFGHADRMPNKGTTVNVYANKVNTIGGLRGTLMHELTHAYDNCAMKNPNSPDNLTFSEVRAYAYGQHLSEITRIDKMKEGAAKQKKLKFLTDHISEEHVFRNLSTNPSMPQELKDNLARDMENAKKTFTQIPQINPFL